MYRKMICLVSFVLVLLIGSVKAATITNVGSEIDFTAWRTDAKVHDTDGDGMYGTDGYIMFGAAGERQSSVNGANDDLQSDPTYAMVVNNAPGQAGVTGSVQFPYDLIDNVSGTTPGTMISGTTTDGATGESLIATIIIGDGVPSVFRLGLMHDNLDGTAFVSPSYEIKDKATDTTLVTVINETTFNQQADWFFVDITRAQTGDVFEIHGEESQNGYRTLGGITFDPVLGPEKASTPKPADGALHSETWAQVSWKAGPKAVSHDIYFGDNFDNVNAGAESTFQGNQADTFFVVGFPGFPYPDGLVPGTTYYWRIDEVNDAEPNSPWKGNIWSFSIPPKTAYFPEPADGAESVAVDVELSWTAGFGAKLHTVYFGETFDEVDNATGGLPQGATSFTPGTLKMAKTYYWRVDEFDVIETHKGDVWSFITQGAVGNPNPSKGAVDVTQTPALTWSPGFGASHEVYFSADAGSLENKASGNLGSESYEPGELEWNTTYYWRVDEANSTNTDSPWTGPTWSFTTANFLIIDDMESYNDLDPADPSSNRIFNAWIDGYDDPTNSSLVGNDMPPFAEQTIVHSGNQSMPMSYDNSAASKSQATLTLTSNRDWTVNGVTTLTIWFRGASDNVAETLYVTLNGRARVNNDNPDAATVTRWTAWNIELQKFADQGVNLSNVNSITIGLSSVTGGSGTMYFDDIRLYPPAQ
ncbi:MAG: hypothetical protein GY774_24625 [Planctomycetes bacterium]|nr:hypothetical protein [Planctomycetota bacterium]